MKTNLERWTCDTCAAVADTEPRETPPGWLRVQFRKPDREWHFDCCDACADKPIVLRVLAEALGVFGAAEPPVPDADATPLP